MDKQEKEDIKMDDIQIRKQQIDEEAIRLIEKADRDATAARQLMADEEADKVRFEAEKDARQIQKDAQR